MLQEAIRRKTEAEERRHRNLLKTIEAEQAHTDAVSFFPASSPQTPMKASPSAFAQVSELLSQHERFEQRKRQQLYESWHKDVFDPIQARRCSCVFFCLKTNKQTKTYFQMTGRCLGPGLNGGRS